MPTADQHSRKADKSRRLLAVLPVADHPEWAATVAFYIAVHRMEQLRHALGHGHSNTHDDRFLYVRSVHSSVILPFQQLYAVSRVARYDSTADFFARYNADQVRDEVIAGWLAAVDRYVDQQLAPPEAVL